MASHKTLMLPSQQSMRGTIDNGINEDYHLLRLYYSWYAGWFYQRRLKMVADLLGNAHYERLIEIGVGSGIFIKEELRHADHVTGIDIHATYHGIHSMLQQENVDLTRVELKQGSIIDIPYETNAFDALVCISVLEHFEDPRPALMEMMRVIKPNGSMVLGFPARNAITDGLFKTLGYRSREIHPGDHQAILHSVREMFTLQALRQFPSAQIPLYIACRAEKNL